ncbi:MAG: membrane-associated protease RseP (regulator of RpoE activity) [Verrucomicrobiales bacterium]|jgi:membrane-associated protease RseP (regulator of RpoE activity)
MFDSSFKREPMNRSERITYWVSLVVVLGLFGAEIVFNYEPRKMGAVFFLVSWGILVAIHEFGHAIMAWMCGWGVKQIVVGFGRTVFQFKIGETPVEFRAFPIEGFVQPYPRDLQSPRVKDALIYAAGPGIELIVALMIMTVLGRETLFTLTDHLGIQFLQAVAGAAVAGAILNLIPMTAQVEGGMVPNDGMGILLALSRTDGDYRSIFDPRVD